MNYLDQLRNRIGIYLLAIIVIENSIVIAFYWALQYYTSIDTFIILAGSLTLGVLLACLIMWFFSSYVVQPLRAVWQAIVHLSPTEHGITAPKVENLRLGRELVASLTAQVYQLANIASQVTAESHRQRSDLHHNFIAQNLPLPLIVLDSTQTIRFTNVAASQYVGIASSDMLGKNVYMVLDMSFPTEATFDTWLKSVRTNSATAVTNWERVRLNVRDDHPSRLFDLAAYYNRDNADNNETIMVLFDHTKQYSQDEQAVSFMALSVHELRTPLTLLRGYIEVFEDEFGQSLDPELQGFLLKMRAQAEQLTSYVNNTLNVARVDNDQLELMLQSEDWSTILKSAVEIISLRAKVRGITLQCRFALNLPPVGVDRLSIREVINNLIDNAIKYSSTSKTIKIETFLNQEGLIETSVQDFGQGIPSSVLPNLFTKFYRDHRNRAQIGGTGLGLYLSKAIIAAHGGNIWVRSREGEGSTFSFTVLPYAQLTESLKQTGDQAITRGAHGWIKNHSLYRR